MLRKYVDNGKELAFHLDKSYYRLIKSLIEVEDEVLQSDELCAAYDAFSGGCFS
ncbi:hypothetical protein D3C76_1629910 [compost metagenome]